MCIVHAPDYLYNGSKSGPPGMLQMKQQTDFDDAREITVILWTYFRENDTVVIGDKYITLITLRCFLNIKSLYYAWRRGYLS